MTLMPNNPENTVLYSLDEGASWAASTGVLTVDRDIVILAKSVDKNGQAVRNTDFHINQAASSRLCA